MIPAEVNSQLGILSSDTFFARIGDDGYMALDCRLDSCSSGAAFTVLSLSCDTFFVLIIDNAVMPRDYQLGGGSGGAVFTVASCSGETTIPDLEVMQGTPEAADWTEACAVTWSMPPNFRN